MTDQPDLVTSSADGQVASIRAAPERPAPLGWSQLWQFHEQAQVIALWLKLLAGGGRLILEFRHRSSIETYLRTVALNLVRDRRDKEWGRWRPSRAARRRGPVAVAAERLMYENTLSKSRDWRVTGLVRTSTWAIAIRRLPAWMIDSSV